MLLFVKVLGILCTVAVPAGVCGTQAFLSKKHQVDHKKKIEKEFQQTQTSLSKAHTDYKQQIDRIQTEKNNLLTTKTELTYKPVVIQTNITSLNSAKQGYEAHHTQLQSDISDAITAHNNALSSKKTEIEQLWTNEKTRVETLQTTLDASITAAQNQNTTLTNNINTLKNDIEKTINDAFYTAPTSPTVP